MLCNLETPRLEQLLTSFPSKPALCSSLISWQLLQATVKQDETKLSLHVTFCLKGVRYFCLQEAHNDTPASWLHTFSAITFHRVKTRVATFLEVCNVVLFVHHYVKVCLVPRLHGKEKCGLGMRFLLEEESCVYRA